MNIANQQLDFKDNLISNKNNQILLLKEEMLQLKVKLNEKIYETCTICVEKIDENNHKIILLNCGHSIC